MSPKFEQALREIIHIRKDWNKETIMILHCEALSSYYIVEAYSPSLNRSDGSENLTINLTEVIMYLN